MTSAGLLPPKDFQRTMEIHPPECAAMSDERLYRYISPVEALEMDIQTGNTRNVNYWLKADANWFDLHATPDDLARRERVREMLAKFEEIEMHYGEGRLVLDMMSETAL